MSVFFRNARLHKCTDDPACSRAGRRTDCSCRQPTGGNYRSETRYREQSLHSAADMANYLREHATEADRETLVRVGAPLGEPPGGSA